MTVFYYTDKGRARNHNEDNIFLNNGMILEDSPDHADGVIMESGDECCYYAVFDGMGGEAYGQMAALIAARGFIDLKKELVNGPNIKYFLNKYLERMAIEIADSIEGIQISGTTCAAVKIDNGELSPFWIGDSRIYLLRDGILKMLSRDDTIGYRQMERGKLTLEQAKKTKGWHMLTKYVGHEDAEFSIGDSITLKTGDRVIICSDGVTDAAEDDVLLDVFASSQDEMNRKLSQLIQNESDDNGTVVVIYI